jgi:hypothetical protein
MRLIRLPLLGPKVIVVRSHIKGFDALGAR